MAAEAQIRLSLVDRVTGPLRRLQARLAGLSASMGLNRIGAQFRDVGRHISNIGSGLGQAARRAGTLTAALGLGAGGVAAVTINLASETAKLGASLSDMSSRLGVSVEAIQEMRYAAQLGGMATGNFDVALRRFIRRSAEAAKGGGAAHKALKELGIQLTDSAGRMRPTEELLGDVAEAMSKVPDQAQRLRLAFSMFDTDGAAMVNVLQDGREAFEGMRREARRTGNVLSEEVTAMGGVYGANVDRLTWRMNGLRNLIGAHMLPVVVDIQEKTLAWVDANNLLIRSTVAEWVGHLRGAIQAAIDPTSEFRKSLGEVIENVRGFLSSLRPLVDFLGGPMQAGLIAVATWILGPMAIALATLSVALVKLGVVILSTPIGWLLAGIAALAGAVYLIYTEWDAFVGYWEGVWQRIKGAFDGTWSGIGRALLEFWPGTHVIRAMSFVVEYLTGVDLLALGSEIVASLWNGFIAKFHEFDAWLAGKEREILGHFSIDLTAIGRAVIESLKAGMQAAWEGVVAWFKSAIDGLAGWMPDGLRSRMGFDINTTETVTRAGSAALSTTSGATMPPPITADAIRATRAGTLGAYAPATPSEMAAESVQADRVEAGVFQAPEPLLVHKPQAIDASTHLGELHIHGVQTDDTAAIRAAVGDALRQQSQRSSDAARSELSD